MPRLRWILPCLLPLALVAASAAARSTDIGFVPDTASPAEIAAAERLEEHLSGLSVQEPPLCREVTAPVRQRDPNSVGEGEITVSPASTEMTDLEATSSYAYCFVVHNRGSDARRFQVSTLDITGAPDPRQQQLVVDPPRALGTWVRPATTEFSLAPGERIFVPYVLETPASLPGGTLTAGIRVTELPGPDAPAAGAVIQPSVVHRLHLTLPGGVARPLDVSQVRAPRLLSHDDAPIAYRARFVVTNRGTVLDVYEVRLDVKGLFGRRVGGAEVPTSTVLPNGANQVSMTWRQLPWIGWYRPRATVESRAGEVQVELPRLWILPSRPWLVAIVVAILLPFVALVVRWRRRRAEWQHYLDEEHDDEHGEDDPYGDGHAGWR